MEVLITVGADGIPARVVTAAGSGSAALDRHVCEFIRREWRAVPGEGARYRIAITFVP
jgi:outer membrane biosynthesis protein TonB